MSTLVAISADFFTAFASLPKSIQTKVSSFITKFKNNPHAPGINYEKISDSADKKICSVRIDDTYRGIVVRQEETGVYLLLWVDHHDEAYEWARSKKCLLNSETGNIQVFDIQLSATESENNETESEGLFSRYSRSDLVKLGVPEEQIDFVKSFRNLSDFYASKGKLPDDAYEYLEWLANDIPYDEVLSLVNENRVENKPDDLSSALVSPGSQKMFMVVEGEDELESILSAPLERWRVFLHPAQKKIVNKDFSGPSRVLGGAGTGKTVVAMHRAKRTASGMKAGEKLLFTTFTANLADDIRENLKTICTPQELRHIEVINLDAWVLRYLRSEGYGASIVYDESLEETWKEAMSRAGEALGFSSGFYEDEWSKVAVPNDAFTRDLYIKASRIGRGTRLDRKKKMMVWNVFEEYLILLRSRQIRDIDTALYECRKLVESKYHEGIYQSIIVDEGQDFSPNAYKLLRVLAGAEHTNDLFIVGDTHQRIYKNRASLSKCGINVKGRSSYLRINYRTPEEIRKYAIALLKGIAFDDMDDTYGEGKECQSLTHGDTARLKHYSSLSEEADAIISEIRELLNAGIDARSICLVARTHKLLNEYISKITQNGLRVYEIKRSKADDHALEGIRVATMHRVKGLEFAYVFIAGMNKGIMPLSSAIDYTDKPSEEESIVAEKCLLYVALTRAQRRAYVSSFGQPSEIFRV